MSFLIFVYTHLIENQPEETGNAPNLNVHVGNLIDMESTGEHSELDFGDSSGSEYCPIPEPNVVDKPNRYQKIATETENVPEDILEISGPVIKKKRKDESTWKKTLEKRKELRVRSMLMKREILVRHAQCYLHLVLIK